MARSEHFPLSKAARGLTVYREQVVRACQPVPQGHVGERSVAAEPGVWSLSESLQ